MLGKELLDFGAVGVDLALEHSQHPGARDCQPALGAGERLPGDELTGAREDLHAFLIGLRPGQLVRVEELLPFALARSLGDPIVDIPLLKDGSPPGKNNNASALINLARNLWGSVGMAVSNTILSQRSQFHQARLVEHVSAFDPQTQQTMTQLEGMFGSQQQVFRYIYQQVQQQASMLSYIDVSLGMAIIVLAVVPLAFLLKKGSPGKNAEVTTH